MKLLILLCICFLLALGSSARRPVAQRDSVLWEEARQLREKGEKDAAYQKYSELKMHQDSVYKDLYARKIESLRDTYKIEELKLENSRENSRISLLLVILSSALFMVGVVCYLYLRRGNRRLLHSKHELERAKAWAEASVRNKSLFLSNMSHEIRTPLNVLVGFSDVLATEGVDEATRRQCNDIIQLNSELLLKLINDVVDISCLNVGNMNFRIVDCDVLALSRHVIEAIEKIKQTPASISFRTELSELNMETDNARLQQVLINLLVNAAKFTKQGSIVLELKSDGGNAIFSVTDTGCGIPLDKQSQIFNRFEKLNEKTQGFGLGLSICELIIKRLGGKIWIDSTYTEGARFLFTHPLKQEGGL